MGSELNSAPTQFYCLALLLTRAESASLFLPSVFGLGRMSLNSESCFEVSLDCPDMSSNGTSSGMGLFPHSDEVTSYSMTWSRGP